MKSEFEKLGYTVIGVSRDGEKAQQNFINNKNLSVDLISDKDEELCKIFKVIKEKKLFGKLGFGIERSTFILDTDFEVIKEYRKVKVPNHANTVLEELRTF